ncbi:hypothetical protein C8Q76DRAFT_272326 [Earliella scabrosa]|nr:hypothetical protein C8Q76DRAFT_272326 [Earliella scabrosa]
MPTIGTLTTVVIVLELCNISLFTLLLATPAPKHSMVTALIISCLLRSILDIAPPIVHKLVPQQLGDQLQNFEAMVSFCVANSILLRYVTVVKSAFAVSFTLPCLSLALLQLQPKRSADDYPRLPRRSILLLCGAPFVWALPVLITPIPQMIRGHTKVVSYAINSCYFDNTAFTVVSLVFTLIPLAIAVIITAIMGVVIWRFSDTVLEHPGWLFVKTKRFARFAGLVFVTMISATFYTVLLALWIPAHFSWSGKEVNPREWRERNLVLTKLNLTSVLWEAITPLLFFCIFAAQEEIYETWLGWLSAVFTLPRRKHRGVLPEGLQLSQHATQGTGTSRTLHIHSTVARDMEQSAPSSFKHHALPGKILTRPLTSSSNPRSSYGDRRRNSGLSPAPPRRKAQGTTIAYTDEQQGTPSSFRIPFQGPSMMTFGSQMSVGSHYNTSSGGEFHIADDGPPSSSTPGTQCDSAPRESGLRSETPGSSRTFGRSGLAKR